MMTFCLVIITVCVSYLVLRHSVINNNKTELQEKAFIIADIFAQEDKSNPAYTRMRNIQNLTEAKVIYVGQDMVARHIQPLGGYSGDSALTHSSIIDVLDVELIRSILDGGKICDIREAEFMGGQVLFAGAPVYAPDGSVAGAAILYRSFVDVAGMTWDIIWLLALSCTLAVALSTIVAYSVSRRLIRPIQALTKTARRMSAGHYGEAVTINQRDEIGELGHALGALSMRLQKVISALKDEKSKLEQTLAGIGEGIVALDQSGRVVHCNNTALELLELSEWGAETAEPVCTHREHLLEMLSQTVQSAERDEAVWKNEGGRSVAVKVWPMMSEENGAIGAVGLLRDVSEAERLEQMRRDYVANISHELRTPLTGIRGMVEPLLDGYMDTEEEKMDCYRVIYQETRRLEKLIGEMLDMSRLQAGRAQVELEPMCIEGVLEAAQRRMRERAQEGGVQMSITFSEPLPQIMGDENRILQVLIILLDNALSFTPPGGSITIYTRVQGRFVYVGVRDTGAGIDPSDLPYIWERFYKADKSRMRTTGTGLGLAIAKLVVECMGGRISVSSEVGKGAEFEFSVPIAPEESE